MAGSGWFGLVLGRKGRPRALTAVTGRLAQASFCIYLSHILFLKWFLRLGLSLLFTWSGLSIPLVALLLLVCGWLLWEALHRLPVICNYLV